MHESKIEPPVIFQEAPILIILKTGMNWLLQPLINNLIYISPQVLTDNHYPTFVIMLKKSTYTSPKKPTVVYAD